MLRFVIYWSGYIHCVTITNQLLGLLSTVSSIYTQDQCNMGSIQAKIYCRKTIEATLNFRIRIELTSTSLFQPFSLHQKTLCSVSLTKKAPEALPSSELYSQDKAGFSQCYLNLAAGLRLSIFEKDSLPYS